MLDAVEKSYPIIAAKDLTPELFGDLMRRYSCVMVRNLVGMADTLHLRDVVAETYRVYDKGYIDTADGGPPPDGNYVIEGAFTESRTELSDFRRFGSLVQAFCPLAAGNVVRMLSKSPIRACIEAYFDSQIGLSLNSSSVRLSERTASVRRVFHQDGNFLGGHDTETINCWVALDPCGAQAPALEVFPERVPELLPAGVNGAMVTWEISENTVYSRLGKENAWIPEFQPGDAFLFDHMHVHRTHLTEAMTRDRYALECWMFPIKERFRSELLSWLG